MAGGRYFPPHTPDDLEPVKGSHVILIFPAAPLDLGKIPHSQPTQFF